MLGAAGPARLTPRSTRRPSVIGQDGKPNAQLAVPHFFQHDVPAAGSPASPSRPSPSARWCRPRSCRSRRPTCSPATSTASSSSRDATPEARGAGLQDRLAGGQVRRAAVRARHGQAERDQPAAARRRLDPADVPGHRRRRSTRAGCTGGRCWSAGRPAWSTARWPPTTRPSAATKHFGSSLAYFPCTHTKVYIAVTALVLNMVVSRGAHAGAAGGQGAGRRRPDGRRGLLLRGPGPRSACPAPTAG